MKRDILDERTCALLYIINILPKLDKKLRYILVENVKGFEKSEAREKLVNCLENAGFTFQEFILCPTQIGIPNSRRRYYLIAKRLPGKFSFPVCSEIVSPVCKKFLFIKILKINFFFLNTVIVS